jgi:hypothetical protein
MGMTSVDGDVDGASTSSIHLRAIHITIDEALLRALDRDAEVKRDGRSAVFRRAVTGYLKARHSEAIAEAYRRGYGAKGDELQGWSGQGAWPEPSPSGRSRPALPRPGGGDGV